MYLVQRGTGCSWWLGVISLEAEKEGKVGGEKPGSYQGCDWLLAG